ncbi:MAG TPA: MerR family transcriptional regulator [Thermomicrobiales bacterium]|nr:MerR family transcriptional regulator [Thermomicrobiales bacterium]
MERYRINELADETDVTPRTIRFYVAEGLLPPPEGNGPAAVYTAAHRDRLRLIGLLKARYLPLREIRKRIAVLTDAEVRAELREAALAGGREVAADEARAPDAALAYLDRVLGRVAESPPAYAPPAPSPRPALPARRARAPAAAPRERWERIVLADGVELHVREDRRREVGPLEALIRHARDLLGEE